MTIQAQLPQQRTGQPLDDHVTHGMPADPSFSSDSFSLLDHRTRQRSLPLDGAPPGRYLSIEHGDEVRLIPLDRPIIHVGRGLISDVRLEDPHVSRRHAIVAQRGDGARVLDDRSSNGTFVNGRQVTISYLSDGDVVRFGSVAMRFVEVAPRIKPAPIRRRIPLPVRAPGGMVARTAR